MSNGTPATYTNMPASTYLESKWLMPTTFCYAEPTATALALLLSDEFQTALRGVAKGRITIEFLHGQAYAIRLDQEFRPGKEIPTPDQP